MPGIEVYQENNVATQSQGRLIVLLYEGAIKFLKQAKAELEAENWGEKGRYINKALAIIDELDMSLDMESGGEISTNLRRLYDFIRRHLQQANIGRDARKIDDAISLLDELCEGWRAIAN